VILCFDDIHKLPRGEDCDTFDRTKLKQMAVTGNQIIGFAGYGAFKHAVVVRIVAYDIKATTGSTTSAMACVRARIRCTS
jgi:hypothetical protein